MPLAPALADGSTPDPESVARLAVTLHRLDEAHRRYRTFAAKLVDISPTELSALLAISDTAGITPSALARDLVLTTGTITSVLDRLVQHGHAQRTSSIEDRRNIHVTLTDRGREAMAILRGAYRGVLATTGTDVTMRHAFSQLDAITFALNSAAQDA